MWANDRDLLFLLVACLLSNKFINLRVVLMEISEKEWALDRVRRQNMSNENFFFMRTTLTLIFTYSILSLIDLMEHGIRKPAPYPFVPFWVLFSSFG